MSESNWVEKYRPTDWSDVQGNNKAVKAIRSWIEDWETGDPPQLLIGPPGTGKTSTAYVAAETTGLSFNTLDASTARKSDDVRRLSGEMRAGEQLVLLDEVDSWHHAVDLGPLNDELRDPKNPVIMTANSEYDVPAAIKTPSTVHKYKLSTASREAKLKEIAKAEAVPLDEKDLERLVDRPDLRSAINDLQLHAEMGIPVAEDEREWESSEFEAMDALIQEGDSSRVDVKPPWLVMWLDQNLRKDYDGLELAAAQDALSRADVYLGEAGGGDYHGWRYAAILARLTAKLRLSEPYRGFIKWDFPQWVKSKVPKPTEDTPEAKLFRELKGHGEVGFRMAGGYAYFRSSLLPLLQRLPEVEKWNLIVEEGLSQTAAEAIGVGSGKYETLTVRQEAEAGEELVPATGNALEGDW